MAARLILFGSDTCVPCVAAKYALAGVEFEYFDVCKRPDLVGRYSIRSVPVLIAIDNEGNAISQHTGRITRDGALTLLALAEREEES